MDYLISISNFNHPHSPELAEVINPIRHTPTQIHAVIVDVAFVLDVRVSDRPRKVLILQFRISPLRESGSIPKNGFVPPSKLRIDCLHWFLKLSNYSEIQR